MALYSAASELCCRECTEPRSAESKLHLYIHSNVPIKTSFFWVTSFVLLTHESRAIEDLSQHTPGLCAPLCGPVRTRYTFLHWDQGQEVARGSRLVANTQLCHVCSPYYHGLPIRKERIMTYCFYTCLCTKQKTDYMCFVIFL